MSDAPAAAPRELKGLSASGGFADGPAFIWRGGRELTVVGRELAAGEIPGEIERYRAARAEARRQLEALAADARARKVSDEALRIFDNHLAMLSDPTVGSMVERHIRSHLNAEAAVRRATDFFRDAFGKMDDAYLRERVRDVDDLERRVLEALMGPTAPPMRISSPAVVVADDLTPSQTISLPRESVLAIVTARGSTTSHVALLARALGVPAVVALGEAAAAVRPGDRILVDGERALVTVRPDAAAAADFGRRVESARRLSSSLASLSADAGRLSDGTAVRICANLQPDMPFEPFGKVGAEGVGLYRTEYLWLGGECDPSEDRQAEVYSRAVKDTVRTMGPDAGIVFRCLDLGGDKLVRGVASEEANPFLGYRSLRWLLGHREEFRTQLRAILRASASGRCAVMFPMVSTLGELREANAELDRAADELRRRGAAFDAKIRRGVMIETPAAAVASDALAGEVDFFSIGTNDLVQYVLAADRGNPSVAYLSEPCDPAVLRLVGRVCRNAAAAGIPVGICGEAAADLALAPLWVGMGVRELSMSAGAMPRIKAVLRRFSLAEAQEFAADAIGRCAKSTAAEIRRRVRERLARQAPELA